MFEADRVSGRKVVHFLINAFFNLILSFIKTYIYVMIMRLNVPCGSAGQYRRELHPEPVSIYNE